jgi:hypothetical protein
LSPAQLGQAVMDERVYASGSSASERSPEIALA